MTFKNTGAMSISLLNKNQRKNNKNIELFFCYQYTLCRVYKK